MIATSLRDWQRSLGLTGEGSSSRAQDVSLDEGQPKPNDGPKRLSMDERSVHMGNFRVDVCSTRDVHLREAVRMCFDAHKTAVAVVADERRIVLLWSPVKAEGVHPLPFPMGHEAAADLLSRWFKQAEFGRQPDIDGSVSRGFRIQNSLPAYWVDYELGPYVICHLMPEWAEHHK